MLSCLFMFPPKGRDKWKWILCYFWKNGLCLICWLVNERHYFIFFGSLITFQKICEFFHKNKIKLWILSPGELYHVVSKHEIRCSFKTWKNLYSTQIYSLSLIFMYCESVISIFWQIDIIVIVYLFYFYVLWIYSNLILSFSLSRD